MSVMNTSDVASLLAVLGRQDLSDSSVDISIQAVLDALRRHLGMNVGFVSQFVSEQRVFLFVSCDADAGGIEVGGSDPLEESFCHHITTGALPELIHDAAATPLARDMEATQRLSVGAHIGVPLVFSDGSVFGSMCCFSRTPDFDLNERNLFVVRVAASVVAELMERHLEHEANRERASDRFRHTIANGDFEICYQPIVALEDGRLQGLEALARFPDADARPPTAWFDEAREAGQALELELALIRRAVEIFPHLPRDLYLGINVSAATVLSGKLPDALRDADRDRLVIELSEHDAIQDYPALNECLRRIPGNWQLAVDDVGAGYSSLRHILEVGPDIMKLDMAFVRDVDLRPSRAALVKAIVAFAGECGAQLVAEGIESSEEAAELLRLGVVFGQGFHFAMPMRRQEVLALPARLGPSTTPRQNGKRVPVF